MTPPTIINNKRRLFRLVINVYVNKNNNNEFLPSDVKSK